MFLLVYADHSTVNFMEVFNSVTALFNAFATPGITLILQTRLLAIYEAPQGFPLPFAMGSALLLRVLEEFGFYLSYACADRV